jgi:hypothetical protein
MCRDGKQKLSSQEHGDMQIISQPKGAIPETKIYPFSFSSRHSLSIRFDTCFSDKIGRIYSKSICINWMKTDSCWSGKMAQVSVDLKYL